MCVGCMNKLHIMLGLIFVLILSGAMAACSVDLDNTNLEIRTDRENVYSTTISAEDDDTVDIKISFDITDISGDTCSSNITTKAEIYRWDATNTEWDLDRTTSTQSNNLEENPFIFTWNNALTVNDNYERYKVEGYIQEGTNELDILEAYIDVQDNSCSGIELVVSDFYIDEGENQTKNFRIENNTNTDFDISEVDVYFTTSLITSGSVDYPDEVERYNNENVEITLEPNYVLSDTTVTGTFTVSGYIGNTFCSSSAVGRKTFEVTVRDTGASGTGGSGTSSDCDDLELHTKIIKINEGQEKKEIFYLKNNSTKRFEILDIDTTQNGLELNSYYYEKYAFPGDIADIVLQAIAPNVTSNKTYGNILEVKGKFSDGKTCNFDDIQRDYDVYIMDSSSNITPNCETITIDVPSEVRMANSGIIPFTITNNSNTRLDVIVESTLTVDPTIIYLPGNTSTSREMFVSIEGAEGNIYLKAQSQCPVQNKTIKVINTASGSLGQVTMSAEVINDNNTQILRIKFVNPTDKAFLGVIKLDLEGIIMGDTIVTAPPGENFTDIALETDKPINGTVRFISNDQEISTTVGNNNNGVFAGFFGLSIEMAGIAIALILIIVAVVLIVTLYEGTRYEKEDQPFVKGPQ